MKECTNGHIFDESRFDECPYCPYCINVEEIESRESTVNNQHDKNDSDLNPVKKSSDNGCMPDKFSALKSSAFLSSAYQSFIKQSSTFLSSAYRLPKTNSNTVSKSKSETDTVALNITEAGINPVRGWLVIVEGDRKGLSFVIHSEKNLIGRGSQFDVDLEFDKAVSTDGDMVIAFDARKQRFYVSPSIGRNNVYHNDDILLHPVELKDYDTVEVGKTKFVFRSFCNEQFNY